LDYSLWGTDVSLGISQPPQPINPRDYAHALLLDLDLQRQCELRDAVQSEAERLVTEGELKALSRLQHGNTFPSGVVAAAQGCWECLHAMHPKYFPAQHPAASLLTERAALRARASASTDSYGGQCHWFQARDGWLALSLVRHSDLELLPALTLTPEQSLEDLAAAISKASLRELVARGRTLGLGIASLGDHSTLPWLSRIRFNSPHEPRKAPTVVDFSGLWAGPLAASLIGRLGGRVIKVESVARPDGARLGPEAFYRWMNASKMSLAINFKDPGDRQLLDALLAEADIVIEASRPRALAQLGISATEFLSARPGKLWCSITGYGHAEPNAQWIAFGDDAAVAGGLVAWSEADQRPLFFGDAIADPLTGLHAAVAITGRWAAGGGELLDIRLAGVAARAKGMMEIVTEGTASAPRTRIDRYPAAPAIGAHNARLAAEFGLS
jgi:hypothetical protein